VDPRPGVDSRSIEAVLTMRLSWTPNASASALHAAELICHHRSKLADSRVETAIGDFARSFGQWIEQSAPNDVGRFWTTLIGHAALLDSNEELAEVVIRKSAMRLSEHSAITQLCGFVDDIEAAYNSLFPKFSEQVSMRAKPLQEHWLGFGQGLLAHLGRLTDKSLVVQEARVVLLQPSLGGSGVSHIDHNMVRIEAVLTNPLAEIPEVVRLAWLLAQLNLDLPMYGESVGNKTLHRLTPLLMLAPILAAAEVVELSRCDDSIAELAIEHWHIPVPRDKDVRGAVVPLLMDWWETYLQTRPAWSTAMQAFSKMLGIH
jgi:hypothetical protein